VVSAIRTEVRSGRNNQKLLARTRELLSLHLRFKLHTTLRTADEVPPRAEDLFRRDLVTTGRAGGRQVEVFKVVAVLTHDCLLGLSSSLRLFDASLRFLPD